MRLRVCLSVGVAIAWSVVLPLGADTPAQLNKLDEALAFLRTRNAQQFALNTAKGIDEESYVSIGGIEQWVSIRGQDRANPVLLFLHGGPGNVTSHWTFAVFAAWEAHFTVVQWDQRGAGRTLRKSGRAVAPTMTLERMTQDGVELAEYLRKRLGKEKMLSLRIRSVRFSVCGWCGRDWTCSMCTWVRDRSPITAGTMRSRMTLS
jgi:hypothetical protein